MSSKKTRKRMRATVGKVIAPFHRDGREKAQINIPEADPLYQEVRITNELTDEDGNKARLKPDADVDVVIEASEDATTSDPPEPKHRH
jgi:hypothetical protein